MCKNRKTCRFIKGIMLLYYCNSVDKILLKKRIYNHPLLKTMGSPYSENNEQKVPTPASSPVYTQAGLTH